MKTEPSPSGLTRRSFIKRSVVAAVAAANLTILTGLVNAQSDAASGNGIPLPEVDPDWEFCRFITEEIRDPATGELTCYECYFAGEVLPCTSTETCYNRGIIPGSLLPVIVDCTIHDSYVNSILCDFIP